MTYRRRAQVLHGWGAFQWGAFLDVLLQVIFFYIITTSFSLAPQINVRIPKAVTSDALVQRDSILIITSENLIYWQNALVSIKDLRQQLGKSSVDRLSILIKADRRASLGRIVDIWNLCKSLGIERINIVTTNE